MDSLPHTPHAHDAHGARYALFSVLDTPRCSGSFAVVRGSVRKHHRPLLVQDEPWEPRIDNGYPSVVREPDGRWRLWYGTCTRRSSCDVQLLLHATSANGLAWHKPHLGLVNLALVEESWASIGRRNNALLVGGGIGVFRDGSAHVNASRRYKAFGDGCWGAGSRAGCGTAGASSADGLRWELDGGGLPGQSERPYSGRYSEVDNRRQRLPPAAKEAARSLPAPGGFRNAFWDEATGAYLLTTRQWVGGGEGAPEAGRAIAIARSATGRWGGWESPRLVATGNLSQQLYSQVTFRYANVLLGLVMVYDALDLENRVHCRLSWAADGREWAWVPHGEPHGGGGDDDFIRLGPPGSFDSHIIFSAPPVLDPIADEVRLYYMGGDGPHTGPPGRNSSLGLATLKRDRFVGVLCRGAAELLTEPIVVAGRSLALTADVQPGGFIRVGLVPAHGPSHRASHDASHTAALDALRPEAALPLTASVTDARVAFGASPTRDGPSHDLGAELVGTRARLKVECRDATLHTAAFLPLPGPEK